MRKRDAPIGLFYDDLDRVTKVARASSLLTHAAAAAALMVAMALRDATPQQMFDEIEKRCCDSSADFAATWRKIPAMLTLPPELVLTKNVLGEGWVGEEAVASAMYCCWRSPDDYSRAVLTAINTDGDSDSIGAITGSAMGAWLGITAIPQSWRDAVEDSAYLYDLGKRLSQKRRN
ncbi:MAG: ADP-ribosylglycohydrolase family protein [Planctomycetota bacterium]|nr:ADP-ribosylglycohydrolase family protein [Planctomycetota bacterium]